MSHHPPYRRHLATNPALAAVCRHRRAVWAVLVGLLVTAAPSAAVDRPAEIAVIAGAKCSADGTCADSVITPERYEHWLRISRIVGGEPRAPEIASGYRKQVMLFLIEATWIRGEAAQRDIVVTARRVRRRLRQQRSDAFESRRHYRRWLRSTGQTRRDMLFRVRTDLLSIALRQRVTAPAGDDPEEQQRLMDEFSADFRARWTAATRCADRYKVESCGA